MRIRLTIAYDGTNYCGWQVQPNGISVQKTLQNAIEDLVGHRVASLVEAVTDIDNAIDEVSEMLKEDVDRFRCPRPGAGGSL